MLQITTNKLLKHIDDVNKITDEEWKTTLNERKIKELEFHDLDRDHSRVKQVESSDSYEKFYGNKKYYTATKRSNEFVKNWIKKESKWRVFLDYACGNGSNAIYAASEGAELSLGFDI